MAGRVDTLDADGHAPAFDRYRVLERIGHGAAGMVYRARDEVLDRDVALKILSTDAADDATMRARFRVEAEAAARLSHPNIVTILDVGEEDGQCYIVMELLRGATLKHYLRRPQTVAIDRRLDLMIQLCSGLNAAHQALIWHRDIKPGNLFVRDDGILKILDFGVARLAQSGATAVGLVVGTPDYMSPEQARGADLDCRSDLFSAGSVCYYMLTGRKPFPAVNLPDLFEQIQHMPPAPIGSECPPDLAAAVMKALEKNPEARHRSCAEFREALERVRWRYGWELAWRTTDLPDAPASPRRDASLPAPATADHVTVIDAPSPRSVASRSDSIRIAPSRPSWTRRIAVRLDAAVRLGRAAARRATAPARRER